MLQLACSNTLLQTMVPDHLRGRVMALYSMMFMGVAPFGALGAGVMAERLGARWTVALGGLACVAASFVYRSRFPAFRVEARQLIVAQGMAGGEPPPPWPPRG
jgi:MFS family permease